jgi:ribosomal protein L22
MTEEKKVEEKIENKQGAEKVEEKKESKQEEKGAKKKIEVKKTKKNYAFVKGLNLHLSVKDGKYICKMIHGKNIDNAMKMIEQVTNGRRVVKMNALEMPHQHGKGVMAGSFPINAAKEFLILLKQLKATAIYNEVELEKAVLKICKTDKASRPYKRGGARAKRAHVLLKLEERKEENTKQKNNKNKSGEKTKK